MHQPLPANSDYELVRQQVRAMVESNDWTMSTLSNVSALLNEFLPDINWVGFYLVREGQLHLGPFQGKVACTQIAIGKGVCGTAVAMNATQLVPNVHVFPGHIACDSASNSEIVIPLYIQNQLVGVLDIDSPNFNRFSHEDQVGLEAIIRELNHLRLLAI